MDHDSLEHLNAFLAAFFDFIVDLHRITGAKIGKVGSDLVSANCVQNIHVVPPMYVLGMKDLQRGTYGTADESFPLQKVLTGSGSPPHLELQSIAFAD